MLRSGLIATKIGNSSHFQDDGNNTQVTILKVDECVVLGVKDYRKKWLQRSTNCINRHRQRYFKY